jgi:hypothetical protein
MLWFLCNFIDKINSSMCAKNLRFLRQKKAFYPCCRHLLLHRSCGDKRRDEPLIESRAACVVPGERRETLYASSGRQPVSSRRSCAYSAPCPESISSVTLFVMLFGRVDGNLKKRRGKKAPGTGTLPCGREPCKGERHEPVFHAKNVCARGCHVSVYVVVGCVRGRTCSYQLS